MPTPKKTQKQLSSIFANGKRFEIVKLLMDNKDGLHVNEIKKMVKCEPSLLSHHLTKLKSASILKVDREGQHKRYTINKDADFIKGRTLTFDNAVTVKF